MDTKTLILERATRLRIQVPGILNVVTDKLNTNFQSYIMKISSPNLDMNSDFPILSRNRSIDENLPFNENLDANKLLFPY